MLVRALSFGLLVLASGRAAVAGVNTWTPTGPEGGYARAVAFDPSTPGVAFTAVGWSIYRSTDYGQSWTAVREGIANGASRIVVDPTNASRVMAGSGNALYRSDDGGLTFGATSTPGNVSLLTIAPNGALYVATFESRIFRSQDFGAQWLDVSLGLPQNRQITDVVVDPQNADTLYALIESEGIYKSTNAGLNWTLLDAFSGIALHKMAVDPLNADRLLLIAINEGLYVSEDGGANWTRDKLGQYAWVGYHSSGTAFAIPWRGPVIRKAAGGADWEDRAELKLGAVEDAAFDPHDSVPATSRLLVATSEGPLLTLDGGTSFEVRGQGLRGSTVYSFAVANDLDGTIYAAYESGPVGIHRRTPSGWVAVNNADLKAIVEQSFSPFAMAVDPGDSETLFVASGTSVVHSFDGGQKWEGPNPDFSLASIFPRAMSFDPSDSQLIYIGTEEHGVYRSDTRGATWFPSSAGLPPSIGIGALAVGPSAAGTVYAAVLNPTAPPLLYRTTDGGFTWVALTSEPDVEVIVSLAVDPSNPDILYAGGIGEGEGLFKSTDAGESWTRVGGPTGDAPGLSIAVDPVVPTNLFMTMNAFGLGAARSVDGGDTWEDVPFAPPGNHPIIHQLILDPLEPYRVIATAYDYGLVELEVSPDLEAAFASIPSALALGGSDSATVRVENHGPYSASAVMLTLSLPSGTTAPVPTPPQGTCVETGVGFECSLGAVRPNLPIDVILSLAAGDTATPGMLEASVTGHESDPALDNNAVDAALPTVRLADLAVTLTPSATTVTTQSPITLTAVATNAGPNASSDDIEVVIDLGDGLTYDGASPSQGACTESGGILTCSLGSIAASEQATIEVAASASGTGAQTPSAHIAASSVDPAADDNTATASIDVTQPTTSSPPSGGGSGTGGGGGGAGGLLELLALLALAGSLRRRPVSAEGLPERERF